MPKRKSEDAAEPPVLDDTTMPIRVKTEGQSMDYSEDVKKKLSTASRTSTACDRCRVRKMRCDDRPDGCIPCRQNQTECKTTDRITGKATVRGYVESLERKIQELETYNRQLLTRVKSLGGDAAPDDLFLEPTSGGPPQWPGGRPTLGLNGDSSVNGSLDGDAEHADIKADGTFTPYAVAEPSIRLPKFRSGLTGNNYLGVSTGDSLLSSIRGTSMNVLGMEIDIADYTSPDLDEPDPSRMEESPTYNKSYRAFIQTAFGAGPKLSKVELPHKQEGLEQAEIYFRGINPFLPILHRPTVMRTLTRMYDDPTFQPSIAETVTVHAMFAILHCQIGARASQNEAQKAELNQSSNFHYHYALGFFSQLMASHTLADVQALALLGMHVRGLPKPGACWMLISITLNLAIELGLHRSAKSWAPTSKRPSLLEIEMRKRVFWGIVILHVTVSGNLGRPLALRSEDCDVEMPEALDDDLLSDDGLDRSKPGKCNFLVGLEGMQVMPIFTDLYNSIYTVKRSPQTYVENVHNLEKRIKDWVDSWPRQIVEQSANEQDPGHVHAQWLEIAPLHMRLLLRHPSLSLTSNAEFNAENMAICLQVSRKMLYHAKQLQKFQCLDGTWQSGALYILAISTTLFATWERRDQITPRSLAELKEEMNSWLSIIGDVGQLLGSGRMLQNAVRRTIEKTLASLPQFLKSPNPAPIPNPSTNRPKPSRSSTQPHQGTSAAVYNQSGYYPSYPTPEDSSSVNNADQLTPQPSAYMNQQSMASSAPSMAFSSPRHYTFPAQYANNPANYDQQSYQANDLPVTTDAAAAAYMNAYTQAQPQYTLSSAYPTTANFNQHSAGSQSSWRDFTGNLTSNQAARAADYMPPASALMQLNRSEDTALPGQDMQMGLDMPQVNQMNGSAAQNWPFF